jgi:phage terminase Nu1 subunit (DNA packaging protein)
MPAALSQDQAAEIAGITTRRLQQLDKADEGPDRTASGGYIPAALGKWIRERILADLGVANDGKAYDYEAERARLTKAQADKTELEVAELRGELISTPKALVQIESMVAAMRSKLLSMPTKVAAKLATTPNELVKAQEAVRVEVNEALSEIASDRFQDEIQARIDRSSASREAAAKPNGQRMGGSEPKAERGEQCGAGPVENG